MKKIYILAALLAVVTAVAAYTFLGSLEEAAKPEEIKTTSIVVAAGDIGEGVFITMDMLALKAMPVDFVPAGALTTVGDAIGKVNKYNCASGQPILASQLGSTEDAGITEGGRLSYTLEDGMRATTVYVTEITGVAGYVNTGDRVDIVCTMGVKELDGEGNEITVPTSMMLLENVLVVQSGIITAQLAEDGESTVYTSLTLSLSPEDCIKLKYAVDYGSITLLLRAVDDTAAASPKNYTGEGLH